MMENTNPSYLVPVLPREQILESLLGPCLVLFGYARVPAIQQIEFDGDGVSFASGYQGMIKIPGELNIERSTANETVQR
jgi:hypothetical protein